MSSNQRLDDGMRWQIIIRLKSGQYQIQICRGEFNLTLSVVFNLWKQFLDTGIVERKTWQGNPRATTAKEDRHFSITARLTGRSVVWVPLSSANGRVRFKWCRDLTDLSLDRWMTALFTDESRFSLTSDSHLRPHKVRLDDEFLESKDIGRMDWPARSPDLNPIEHSSGTLGRVVATRNHSPGTF
ncbi:transposable element Tcb2 transposase [Trichonephila clavipes]|nr:transposable element Tcb2 transposase [Trichonephila clavipes]